MRFITMSDVKKKPDRNNLFTVSQHKYEKLPKKARKTGLAQLSEG